MTEKKTEKQRKKASERFVWKKGDMTVVKPADVKKKQPTKGGN